MSKGGRMQLWAQERYRDQLVMGYRTKRVLFSGESEFQGVDVIETEALGRMLLIDGLVMVTERDEFIYHDMIAHVPLFVHPNPRRVLIIGGGDGGTAREVLRHQSVNHCRMIEIDEVVVNACKEFIPQTASKLSDPRLELTIEDGVKFVAETDQKFDVILVDSTDPIGPAKPLFGPEFYANVYRILNDKGIVVSQGGSPFYELDVQRSMLAIVSKLFARVNVYNFSNMTYPGGMWSFIFSSKELCPVLDFNPQRVRESGMKFSYYNEYVHRGAFMLPSFMTDKLGEFISPIHE